MVHMQLASRPPGSYRAAVKARRDSTSNARRTGAKLQASASIAADLSVPCPSGQSAVPPRLQRIACERDVAQLSLLLRKSLLPSGTPNMILTSHIQLTQTWKELYRLLLEFSDMYNHINVTATVTHLCKLVRSKGVNQIDQHDFEVMMLELGEVAEHLLAWYRPREVANLIYGLAKLQCYNRRLIQLLVGRAQIAGLSSFKEQELANLVWALAKLGHPMPADLMNSFLSEVLQRLGRFKPQEMSNIVWSLAVMKHYPGQMWMEKVLEQCGLQFCLFKAQEFSSLIWSLATLQHVPNDSWLRLFISRSYPILSNCNEQNLANMMWGLGRLGAQPFSEWMLELEHQLDSRQYVLAGQPQHMSMLLAGMAKLKYKPRASLLASLTTRMLPHLRLYKCMDLSECLWALGHFRYRPCDPFMQAWTFHMRTKLDSSKSQDLSMALWALARLNICPDVEWMRECSFHVIRTLQHAQLQHMANVMWAYTKLHVMPTRRWLSLILDAFVARCLVEAPRSQELANVVWALPQLVSPHKHRYFVEACSETLYRVEDQCYGCMRDAKPKELVQMVLGFSRLDYLPGAGWLAKHQAACLSQVAATDEREFAALRAAYQRFDCMTQRPTSFIFSMPDSQACSMVEADTTDADVATTDADVATTDLKVARTDADVATTDAEVAFTRQNSTLARALLY